MLSIDGCLSYRFRSFEFRFPGFVWFFGHSHSHSFMKHLEKKSKTSTCLSFGKCNLRYNLCQSISEESPHHWHPYNLDSKVCHGLAFLMKCMVWSISTQICCTGLLGSFHTACWINVLEISSHPSRLQINIGNKTRAFKSAYCTKVLRCVSKTSVLSIHGCIGSDQCWSGPLTEVAKGCCTVVAT